MIFVPKRLNYSKKKSSEFTQVNIIYLVPICALNSAGDYAQREQAWCTQTSPQPPEILQGPFLFCELPGNAKAICDELRPRHKSVI